MKSMQRFLQEVKIEFSKIVWPKFNVLVESLVVVLVLVVLFSIYLGSLDLLFYRLAERIFSV